MSIAANVHMPSTVSIGRAILAPFRMIGLAIVLLAESGPRMAEVRKLNALSDEDLAARGLTRADEIHRIFSDRYYI